MSILKFQKTKLSIVFICLVLLVNFSFCFNVQLTNLVGLATGPYNDVPLPSKVKSASEYVPLIMINITTNTPVNNYALSIITVTIQALTTGFNPAIDLESLSNNGIALFKDSIYPNINPNKWNGATVEKLIQTTKFPSDWISAVGSSSWTVKLSMDLNDTLLGSTIGNYTFYICVKTSNQITDGDKFRIKLDKVGDIILFIKDITGSSDTIRTPDGISVSTITADTTPPKIKLVYDINPTNGTTRTVKNIDTYNIYTTTDIAKNPDANNTLDLRITLEEDVNSLTDNNIIKDINSLFFLDTSSLDLNVSSFTLSVSTVSPTEFSIKYTILTTTVNSPTSSLPVGIKIRDAAGNWSEMDTSFYCYIDRTIPEPITINSPSSGMWIGKDKPELLWNISSEPNLNFYCVIVSTDSDLSDFLYNSTNNGYKIISNDSVHTQFGKNSDWTGFYPTSSNTQYYWGVIAIDKAGNLGEFSTGRSFNFDDKNPNIYSNNPTGNITTSTPTITVKIDDVDNFQTLSGIDFSSTTLKIDNQTVSFSTSPIDTSTTVITYIPTSPLTDGNHSVSVLVVDNVGNNKTLNWNFYVETTKPDSVDSDNDGYSDYNETKSNSNPVDISSYPTGKQSDFYPVLNKVVNADEFISKSSQTIKFRIDDYDSSLGLDISSIISSISVSHSKGTTENWYLYSVSSQTNYAIIGIQIARTLSTNGSDDGIINVKYIPKDSLGNTNSQVTRTFIYDTQPPVISTVNVPVSGDTESSLRFVINSTDTYGICTDADAVQLHIWSVSDTPFNMSSTTNPNEYSVNISKRDNAGIYYYYFSAKDKAGNIKYYPAGGNTDKYACIQLSIADKTSPKPTVYQIKTLLGYTVTGITTTYTSTDKDNKNVKSIPVLYADPLSDISNNYNLLKATVPSEAISVNFQYKTSSSPETNWNNIPTVKTTDTVNDNPVYQAYWDTTGLTTKTYYDIRVIASDFYGNTSTPTIVEPGFVQVYLENALSPTAKIDTSQYFPKNAGIISGKKLLLNADTSNSKNLDITSVTFQYKKLNDTEWKTENIIATDSDKTSNSKTQFTVYLKESEIPYLNLLNGVVISSITLITLDETTSGTTYDKQMNKTGDEWISILDLPPGSYKYNYKIFTPEGTKILTKDPREYSNNNGSSQITINSFSCEWDLSNLSSGEYQIRAIANDSRNNQDSSPETITIIYNPEIPLPPEITFPANSQRLKSGTNISIKANIPSTEIYVSTVIFEYSLDRINWYPIGLDSNKTDGWSVNFNLPSLNSDTTYYLRSFAYNSPPAISTASAVVSFIIDASLPQIQSFIVEGVTGTVVLNSGYSYVLKMTTLDNDISTVSFNCGGGITGSFTPNSGIIFTKAGGSGTSSDPYYYTCNFTPSNKDFTSGTLTVTVYDSAGNFTTKTINIQVRDITPTIGTITKYNNGSGEVSVSNLNYIGKSGVTIKAELNENDGGTLKFQYSSNQSGPWINISELNITGTTLTSFWNPVSNGIPEGTYYLRVLATDDDNNVDPQPTTITVILDYTQPTINSISISPEGTIDCAETFTLTAKTNDTDIKNIVFQYYDPANGWLTIDDTTGNRLIMAVSENITPNNIGLTEINYVCAAVNIKEKMNLQIRAIATDKANNSNMDKTITVSFDDTKAPIAVSNIDTAGNVYAETSDANIKSVLFQYCISDSSSNWIDLGTQTNPDTTYSNIGKRWKSPVNLTNLPSGTYNIRAIPVDMFNNVDINKSPVISVLIQVNVSGSKTYSMKKSQQISVGISDIKFDTVGGAILTLEVKSANNLVSAPVISMLITDGSGNTITKTVQTSGSGTNFTGTVQLENFAQAGTGNARITVAGDTGAGSVYGESAGLVMTTAGNTPMGNSPDGMASLTNWSNALNTNTSLLIAPKISPSIPPVQLGILKSINRCYEFCLADGTKEFPQNVTATLQLKYSDSDLTGIDESKLGVAYWDSVEQKWSASGISNVNVDRTANTVTFNTSHFSAFSLMEINSVREITFESPKSNGFANENPVISIKATDNFSSISSIKIIIDGQDQTNSLLSFAASDGIDNNGNGIIDEKGEFFGGVWNPNANEQAFNVLNETSARFKVKAPLQLTKGEHSLTVVVSNVQGQTTQQSIKFNVSDVLNFASEPYNYPNPFNPRKITTKIVPNLTKEADVKITILDFSGEKVCVLEKHLYDGTDFIEWNGKEETTQKYLADGVYFAKIDAKTSQENITKYIKIAITSK